MVYITKTVDYSFEEALERVIENLKKEGFGVITEIDVKQLLKEKIGADFRKYRILGACNPNFAHQALQAEDKVGLLLPCNVVVQEHGNGKVEVTTFNPIKSMPFPTNPVIEDLGNDVECKLTEVIKKL